MKELELVIGAHVYCKNGKCGRLAKVIIDPAAWRVTHVIVEDGYLQRRYRIFPIATVTQTDIGDIFLSLAEEELGTYPEYAENSGVIRLPEGMTMTQEDDGFDDDSAFSAPYDFPSRGQPAGPADLLVIDRGTPLAHRGEPLGRLDYFLARSGDGRIKGLVMQQPPIPQSMVRHIDSHLISLGEEPRRLHRQA